MARLKKRKGNPNAAVNNVVDMYESSSESENDSTEAIEINTRKRKRHRVWIEEATFDNKQEAIEFVDSEQTWGVHYTNKTFDGRKRYYRCNKVKKRGTQCDAGLYILCSSTSLSVDLFRTQCAHNCQDIDQQSQLLPPETKLEIERLIVLKFKPKRIFEHLRQNNFPITNITQVYNFLQAWRRKEYGPTSISLGELEEWCISRNQIPQDDDQPFVIYHQVQYPTNDFDSTNELTFESLLNHVTLLNQSKHTKRIHLDTTYKLVWEGFPVLVVGTTDQDRHFHPIAIAVSSNEKTSSFTLLFKSLKNWGYSPTHLISDASLAIRQSFVDVFGKNSTLVMCWAHTRRNVEKHLNLCSTKLIQTQILQDIDSLQLSHDVKSFTKAKKLFIDKWKNEKRFLEYLNEMWFSSHELWFEGASFGPSSNNGLESFNNVIKNEETLRERLPLSRFLSQCVEMTSRWSNQYNSGGKCIAALPSLDLSDWTEGYHWAKANKDVSTTGAGESLLHVCPAAGKSSLTKSEIRNITQRRWTTFDSFKCIAFMGWIVRFDQVNWRNSTCSCPCFLKKFKCKHVIGLALRFKLEKPPPAAKQIPIGQKRKRGRPRLATQALIVD